MNGDARYFQLREDVDRQSQYPDYTHNSQQKHLEHNLLTVSATVDGNDVNMLEDNASPNAEAPLTVVNTRGFDLPQTGDTGTWMFGAFGVLLMAGSLFGIVLLTKKARKEEKTDR